MVIDVLFLTETKQSSTKMLVVRALAAMHGGSLAQVQRALRSDFQRRVTYQAVRQAVRELEAAGAIEQTGKEFRVRAAWVSQLKDTVHALERATKQQMQAVNEKSTHVTLHNLEELGNFILGSLEQKYFKLNAGEDVVVHMRHLWIPFSDPVRRERLTKLFTGNKTRVFVEGSTLLDRILARWYKRFGTVQLGAKQQLPYECIVHGDCVVQIYLDPRLRALMDSVYRVPLKLDILEKLTQMTHAPHSIKVVITRDKQVAAQLREAMTQ